MRLTGLTPQHLPEVLRLTLEMGSDHRTTVDWLRSRTLSDPTCTPELLLIAEEQGRVIGYCFACVREGQGVVNLLAVGRDHRRRGVGSALLDEIEARLVGRDVSAIVVGGVAPNYFWPGVDLGRTELVSFLLHRGYDADRVARVDMEVDLTRQSLATGEDEARLGLRGIQIRRAVSDDAERCAEFALAQFSRAWRDEQAEAFGFCPVPLFVAQRDQEIVGFAAYDVTGVGRFGPTGTRPDLRRLGIGTVLLRRCLASMRYRGDAMASIGWAGPLGFYARAVDAWVSSVYWVFTRTLDAKQTDYRKRDGSWSADESRLLWSSTAPVGSGGSSPDLRQGSPPQGQSRCQPVPSAGLMRVSSREAVAAATGSRC